MQVDEKAPREAAPDEVEFVLSWRTAGAETLKGDLIARNVSNRDWRLSGKPIVIPFLVGGSRAESQHVVTLEGRMPGYVVLKPGETAQAAVSLSWWNGAELDDELLIEWPGGSKTCRPSGPRHPEKPSTHPMATSSSWFHRN